MSVVAMVLDLVRWIEVLDARMHLTMSPNCRHHLVTYRVVRIFRCYTYVKHSKIQITGQRSLSEAPTCANIYTVKCSVDNKLQICNFNKPQVEND